MDRNLCRCQHWREEHYDENGAFQGQLFGCHEYQGIEPDEDRVKNRDREIAAARKKIRDLKAKAAAEFYK